MEEDFDRAEDPLAAKFAANVRLQTGGLTVHAQKPGKRLQRRQRLPWRAQYTKMEVEAMEPGIAMLLYGLQIVHGDYRITTDQRPMPLDEIAPC